MLGRVIRALLRAVRWYPKTGEQLRDPDGRAADVENEAEKEARSVKAGDRIRIQR